MRPYPCFGQWMIWLCYKRSSHAEEELLAWLTKPEHFRQIFSGPMDFLGVMHSGRSAIQVALHFVELDFDKEQQRIFDVKIAAKHPMSTILANFDIYGETGRLPSSL